MNINFVMARMLTYAYIVATLTLIRVLILGRFTTLLGPEEHLNLIRENIGNRSLDGGQRFAPNPTFSW